MVVCTITVRFFPRTICSDYGLAIPSLRLTSFALDTIEIPILRKCEVDRGLRAAISYYLLPKTPNIIDIEIEADNIALEDWYYDHKKRKLHVKLQLPNRPEQGELYGLTVGFESEKVFFDVTGRAYHNKPTSLFALGENIPRRSENNDPTSFLESEENRTERPIIQRNPFLEPTSVFIRHTPIATDKPIQAYGANVIYPGAQSVMAYWIPVDALNNPPSNTSTIPASAIDLTNAIDLKNPATLPVQDGYFWFDITPKPIMDYLLEACLSVQVRLQSDKDFGFANCSEQPYW